MTDVRISQVPVQVIIRDSDPDVRLTQIPVQVVASHSVPGVRMYQAPVQVMVQHSDPEIRMYQAPLQVLALTPIDAQVSQEVLQVLHGGEPSDAKVSQEVLQVLHGGETSDVQVSQEVLQVLRERNDGNDITFECQENIAPYIPVTPVPTLRISQAPLQVLLNDLNSDAPIRISQAPLQVLLTDIGPPEIRLSQAPIQVLLSGGILTQYQEIRVSQAPIQVLTRKIPNICFIICEEDGGYPTGTFEYVLLLGADVATATFMQSGSVYVLNGEACITPISGRVGDDIILVLQSTSLNLLGAYEGVLI